MAGYTAYFTELAGELQMKSSPEQHMIMSKDKGLVFDIKRFAVHDGAGIRTTVF